MGSIYPQNTHVKICEPAGGSLHTQSVDDLFSKHVSDESKLADIYDSKHEVQTHMCVSKEGLDEGQTHTHFH